MTDGINELERLVRQSSLRHRVLASNIANVDTPNYQARDVKFGEVLGSEMRLATTNAKHISAPADGSASAQTTSDESQPWADQNNVEMDVEVAKMTENAMFFQTAITLLEKKFQMFKNALKTSG